MKPRAPKTPTSKPIIREGEKESVENELNRKAACAASIKLLLSPRPLDCLLHTHEDDEERKRMSLYSCSEEVENIDT